MLNLRFCSSYFDHDAFTMYASCFIGIGRPCSLFRIYDRIYSLTQVIADVPTTLLRPLMTAIIDSLLNSNDSDKRHAPAMGYKFHKAPSSDRIFLSALTGQVNQHVQL